MDVIKQLGELAFGSRLKRLVKRTDSDIARVYRELDVDFRPRWFPLMSVLAGSGRISITDAADALHYSHTAVNKLAGEMNRNGLLVSSDDPQDGRKRLLSLTKKGRETVTALQPILAEIRQVTEELVSSSDHHILRAAEAIENELDQKSVYTRLRERLESRRLDRIEIIEYHSRYKRHFSTLNRAWLEELFKIEEDDERVLADPHREIIKKGGRIVFARLNRKIVGTGALIKFSDDVFELAKMAVVEHARRQLVGTKLTLALIERGRAAGARHIYLETHPKLKIARRLYMKTGFKEVKRSPIPPKFKRRRIVMKLDTS